MILRKFSTSSVGGQCRPKMFHTRTRNACRCKSRIPLGLLIRCETSKQRPAALFSGSLPASLVATCILLHSKGAIAFPSLDSSGVVPVKREIVEEVLMQRFSSKVKNLSDEELSALMEQLLKENATIPSSVFTPEPPRPPNPFSNNSSSLEKISPPPVASSSLPEPERKASSSSINAVNDTYEADTKEDASESSPFVRDFQRRAGVATDDSNNQTLSKIKLVPALPALSVDDAIRLVAILVAGPLALVTLLSWVVKPPETQQQQEDGSSSSKNQPVGKKTPGQASSSSEGQQTSIPPAAIKDEETPWWSGILSFFTTDDDVDKQGTIEAASSTSQATNNSTTSNSNIAPKQVVEDTAQQNGQYIPSQRAGEIRPSRPPGPPPPPPFGARPPPPRTAVNGTNGSSSNGVVWRRKERNGAAINGNYDVANGKTPEYIRNGSASRPLIPQQHHTRVVDNQQEYELATNNDLRNVDMWSVPLDQLKSLSQQAVEAQQQGLRDEQKEEEEQPESVVAINAVQETGNAVDTEDLGEKIEELQTSSDKMQPFKVDMSRVMDNAEPVGFTTGRVD